MVQKVKIEEIRKIKERRERGLKIIVRKRGTEERSNGDKKEVEREKERMSRWLDMERKEWEVEIKEIGKVRKRKRIVRITTHKKYE